MIIGLGNDIIDIRRVEKTIERFGERFLDRIFTDVERAKSDARAARAASYVVLGTSVPNSVRCFCSLLPHWLV